MRIGIAMSRDRPNWPARQLTRAFEAKGSEVILFCLKDVTAHLNPPKRTQYFLPRRKPLDVAAIILRSVGQGSTDQITSRISLLESMEFSGIRIFNSAYSHRRAKDKLATLVWLAREGIPIPRTTVTERMAAAVAATRRYGDVVSKPLRGSQGRGVFRLNEPDVAFRVFKVLQTAGQTMIVQQFIKTPGRDIRVFIVGDRAIGAMYRYSKPGAWKTNIAAGGEPVACELTPELEALALRAARALQMDIAGIDILESESGFLVSECNSAPNWSGLQRATGVDAAKEIVKYVLANLRA